MGNWQDGLVGKSQEAPAPQVNWKDGVVQPQLAQAPPQAPQSAPTWMDGVVPQSKGLNLPSDMSISARTPTLFERAKDLFSSGPILKELPPEIGLPADLANLGSQYASLTGHPTVSKVLGGYGAIQGALGEQIKETTTPGNAALLVGSMGLSALPGAA